MFEWLGGSAKMIAQRQVGELSACGFECVSFGAYRGGQRQLFLRFHSGKVYRYFGFPPDQYDELLVPESKVGYFAESIQGKFFYEEVREAHGNAG
uniref:KTSC domain-containing protein n=1 Tax=Solibacter usitatus (strain Ellin6076) TaxID=234267 RepID=Q02BA2_SOLUE